jgi:hypothetical protein
MLVAVDRGHGATGEDDEDLLAVEGVLAAVSARVEREPPDAGLGGAAARRRQAGHGEGWRGRSWDHGHVRVLLAAGDIVNSS